MLGVSYREYKVTPEDIELIKSFEKEMSVDLDFGKMLLRNKIFPWCQRDADMLMGIF